MIVRSNCYTTPGGDTVQIDMTAKYLRDAGVEVQIALASSRPIYGDFDLLHFFNIIRPDDILPHINHTVPYVISTIFVDYAEFERENRKGVAGYIFRNVNPGIIEYIKALARWVINGDRVNSNYYLLYGHNRSIRKVLLGSKILLPNSTSEFNRFTSYIGQTNPYNKVVNAIDPKVFDRSTQANEKYRNHILCVGRIEGRKNQLNLIKALAGSEIQLTIIGKPSPNHIAYYEACKNLASAVSNVHFIEHIRHEELVKIYKAAKVHALPSWFETTGLSSLEAAVMGCNIVITKKGDTEEYFQDMAFYCEPNDVDSIREAVIRAYNSEVDQNFSSFILKNYTWEITARQTLEAYHIALGNPIKPFQNSI
jgi:glycosyltransferase involved in cell wall biosynthesis